ncbi:MAG: nucleotide exchange factor GrpE [Nitrospinota bacterium]|nr:MAG: nucleotide exchange factor GrpE [Nitrospinota bacterium]
MNRLRREERKTLLLDWLEIVDNLERALEHTTDTTDERLREGIQALHRQAMSILARYGVSRMKTIGERFDPFRHEAVGQAEGSPSGTIVGEMLPGYEIEGEVLRPARVIVAR